MRARAWVVAVALLTGGVAHAQPGSDAVVAEALFREGRRLMKEGAFEQACPKLEESQRLDPKIGTLLNLAACHAAAGRTATAWAEYNKAAAQATHAGRAEYAEMAREQIALLEPKLSRVVLETSGTIDGLVVSLDGTPLGASALHTPLPLDPGKHIISARAPNHLPWTRTVDVPSGPSTQTVLIPPLAAEAKDPAPSPRPVVDASSRSSALPWTLSAVALTGFAVGGYFGVRAFSKNDAAEAYCMGTSCTQEGIDLDRDARRSATISTIAFGVGLAAAVGAVWVWTSTKPEPVRVGFTGERLVFFAAF